MKRALLWLELITIFFALPAVYAAGWLPLHEIWVLLMVFVLTLGLLWRDRGFDRAQLWNLKQALALPLPWRRVAASLVFILAIAALLWREELFHLPFDQPVVWLMILLLYPVFSVYPQELIYRAFFFHRYRDLLGQKALFVLNVLAFSFLHIVFLNPVAVLLTLIGGVVFAQIYLQTRSLAAVSAEHAFYGSWVFTVGLGSYFYRSLWFNS